MIRLRTKLEALTEVNPMYLCEEEHDALAAHALLRAIDEAKAGPSKMVPSHSVIDWLTERTRRSTGGHEAPGMDRSAGQRVLLQLR